MINHCADADYSSGTVMIVRLGVAFALETHRRKNNPTTRHIVIVIAIYIDVATGRAGVIRWHPDPVRPDFVPIAPLPGIPGIAVAPCARHPRVVPGRRFEVWSFLQAGRRLFQIFHFFHIRICPVA